MLDAGQAALAFRHYCDTMWPLPQCPTDFAPLVLPQAGHFFLASPENHAARSISPDTNGNSTSGPADVAAVPIPDLTSPSRISPARQLDRAEQPVRMRQKGAPDAFLDSTEAGQLGKLHIPDAIAERRRPMFDEAALAHTANFTTQAILILVNCLKNQGALGERQYENALRATVEADGAPRGRLDYKFLKDLLHALEKQEPGKPPRTDPIH